MMGSTNRTKREEMEKAFKRQHGKCHLCGEPMNMSKDLKNMDRATADHIVPKSQGGRNRGNIKAAHAKCNFKRGNKKLNEFQEEKCV